MVVVNKSFWTVSVKYNPYFTSSINQTLPFKKNDITKNLWDNLVLTNTPVQRNM